MSFKLLSKSRCFSGNQFAIEHLSESVGLPMRFGIFLPDAASFEELPVIVYLSGFTGSYRTLFDMGVAQSTASELGVILVSPDTSPRKSGAYAATGKPNVGESASYYIDATQSPWDRHWRMETYVSGELPYLLQMNFPVSSKGMGIAGHCMGGHGALCLGLKHPDVFCSVSALAPICSVIRSSWGVEAYGAYHGELSTAWEQSDATSLLSSRKFRQKILIDVGEADEYRHEQLGIDLFVEKCRALEQGVILRVNPGYDHSLYFVQTSISEHIEFHKNNLDADNCRSR